MLELYLHLYIQHLSLQPGQYILEALSHKLDALAHPLAMDAGFKLYYDPREFAKAFGM